MDWSTLSGLYSNVDDYTGQLRALEDYHRQQPDSAAVSFVLAYHYLTCGHLEAAANQLDNVLRANPQDLVAKRLLQALPLEQDSASAEQLAQKSDLSVPDLPETQEVTLDVSMFYGTWNSKNQAGTTFKLDLKDLLA